MYRLIGRKSKALLFFCNNEIGFVDCTLERDCFKVNSDSDSGQENDVNDQVKIIEEMKVDEQIQMEVDSELDFGMIMEMEEERQ